MSAPRFVDGKANERERSEDRDVFVRVPTLPVPGPRQIPFPEFIPTERTSTASFKAPVTSAGRKKMEAPKPPPPPPGTLTTAMGYISSPVKYISSMFMSSSTQPESKKGKEKVFKIDLEKEYKKQVSPKLIASASKVQAPVIIAETSPPVKTPQAQPPSLQPPPSQYQVKKSQSSSWRRKNYMENGQQNPVPIPRPTQRRFAENYSSQPDSSPKLNELMISSSDKQNAYRVMSKHPTKVPDEEIEKKPKKDFRNGQEKLVRTGFYRSGMKNTPHAPATLITPSPRDDYQLNPSYPMPTVLPPRVPPPTFTIRSKPNSETQEEVSKGADFSGDNDQEESAAVAISIANDRAELLAYKSTHKFRMETSSSVDDEEDYEVQDTLGRADLNETVKVSRLDQLPDRHPSSATTLKNLFHNAKLVHSTQNDAGFSDILPAGRVGAMDVMLCATTIKYPSPTVSQSSTGTFHMKGSKDLRSPTRRQAASANGRSQKKNSEPILEPTLLIDEKNFENEARLTQTGGIPINSKKPGKAKPGAEIVPKSVKNNTQKQTSMDLARRKLSPLIVQDKPKTNIEDIPSKSLNRKSRSNSAKRSRSPAKEVLVRPSSPDLLKPKIMIIPKPKTKDTSPVKTRSPLRKEKDQSPAKPQQSSEKSTASTTPAIPPVTSISAAAAATIAASAATAAISSSLQSPKVAETPEQAPDPPPQAKPSPKEERRKQMHTPLTFMNKTSREHDLQSPKKREGVAEAADSAANIEAKPKQSLSAEARDRLKNKLAGLLKESPRQLSPDNIVEVKEKEHSPYRKAANVETSNVKADVMEEKEDNLSSIDNFSCIDNYCGDPAKFCRAATMMGEFP